MLVMGDSIWNIHIFQASLSCILRILQFFIASLAGRIAQSVTFLATDAFLTADPGVALTYFNIIQVSASGPSGTLVFKCTQATFKIRY